MVLQELKEAVLERRKGLKPATVAAARGVQGVSEAESRLLRSVMDSEEVRRTVLEEMQEEDLEASRIAEVVRAIRGLVVKGEDVTYPRVSELVSDDARDILTRVAAWAYPPATLEEGRGCLLSLRVTRFEKQMGVIQKRLESAGAGDAIDDLLRLKVQLKRQIEALRRASPVS